MPTIAATRAATAPPCVCAASGRVMLVVEVESEFALPVAVLQQCVVVTRIDSGNTAVTISFYG